MTNKTKFLVIAGALIGIGAALLFFGSQSITADIVIEEGQICLLYTSPSPRD